MPESCLKEGANIQIIARGKSRKVNLRAGKKLICFTVAERNMIIIDTWYNA